MMLSVIVLVEYLIGLMLCYKIFDWFWHRPLLTNHKERYILITGCDSGFGYKAALDLDKLGCHVFAACLDPSNESKLRSEASSRLQTLSLDVRSTTSIRDAYQFVLQKIPQGIGLWGLINNAGVLGKFGQSDWLYKEDYEEPMRVNFFGSVEMITTFLPLIKAAKGRIINTSSIIAVVRLGGTNPYTASKCAISGFSDGLRREIYPFQVSVHVIEPGLHKTNFMKADEMEKSLRETWRKAPEEVIQNDYGEAYLEKAVRLMLDQCIRGITTTDLEGVIQCYVHAMLAKRPRLRYHPGNDARFLWLPLSKLPDWLADYVIKILEFIGNVPKPQMSHKK